MEIMNSKIKVALIFPRGSESLFSEDTRRTFGGATVQMYNIAKELLEYEDIELYCLFSSDKISGDFNDKTERFNIVNAFSDDKGILASLLKFHNALCTIDADIVVQRGLTLFSCLLAVYAKLKRKLFIFMFAHDVEVSGIYQSSRKKCRLYRLLLRYAGSLITQNTYQEKYLKEKYQKHSILIRNGFPISPRRDLEKKHILWVGRCESWKNPGLFLDLARRFPEEVFVMVCPRSKNSPEGFYEKLICDCKKIQNLEFIERVPFWEINEYFEEAKLFVNTSKDEGFPNTFIQAAMNSAPIMSLNVNPDNILEDHDIGFYAHGDFGVLIENLKNILGDTKTYEKMSNNIREYAAKYHDIEKCVATFYGKMKELAKQNDSMQL